MCVTVETSGLVFEKKWKIMGFFLHVKENMKKTFHKSL